MQFSNFQNYYIRTPQKIAVGENGAIGGALSKHVSYGLLHERS